MVSWLTRPSSSTLLGSPGAISAILSLTAWMVAKGFAPYRAITTPPLTSAPPLSSRPLRVAGPRVTRATSLMRSGTLSFTATTACSRSSTERMYPRPRTRYSTWFTSMVLAPASRLLLRTACITWWMPMPKAFSASGSTSTWYSRTMPPMEATSLTPSTPFSAYFTWKS